MGIDRFLADYRKMGKPRQLEDVWDNRFFRPVSALLVVVLRLTPITPNMVSGLSVLVGWWAGWGYYLTCREGNDFYLSLYAGLLLYLHTLLDCADGQLARVTGRLSDLGRTMDGVCDNLGFAGVSLGILFGCFDYSDGFRPDILAWALVGSVSHSLQCGMTDLQRGLFRYYYFKDVAPDDESPAALRRSLAAPRALWLRPLVLVHLAYVSVQYAIGASGIALRNRVAELRRAGQLDEEFFLRSHTRKHLRLLAGWSALGPNAHKWAVTIAAFLPVVPGSCLGALGCAWVWVVEAVAMNALLAVLMLLQRRLDARTLAALAQASPRPVPASQQ